MKHFLIVLTVLVCVLSSSSAQEIRFSGQLRERSELDAKSFRMGQNPDVFHLLRTRLKALARLNSNVQVTVEVQDARTFGQKKSTLNTGSPAFDLRQGYVEVASLNESAFGFRLGRQVLAWGNERLIGPIEWNNFSQSFDAGMVTYRAGAVSAEVFGAAVARNDNGTSYNRDVFATGLAAAWKPAGTGSTAQLLFVFDNPKDTAVRQNRFTTWLQVQGVYGGFDYSIDGAYQFGDYIARNGTLSIGAHMIGLRAGYTIDEGSALRIGIGFDRLSGKDPDPASETYGVFNTLYASNHAKYGHMDYFPSTALDLGLNDLYFQIGVKPAGSFGLNADVHVFSTATDPSALPGASPDVTASIGMELDTYVTWTVAEAVQMSAGYAVFDGAKDRVVLPGRKTTNWAYAMTTVNF